MRNIKTVFLWVNFSERIQYGILTTRPKNLIIVAIKILSEGIALCLGRAGSEWGLPLLPTDASRQTVHFYFSRLGCLRRNEIVGSCDTIVNSMSLCIGFSVADT